MRAPVVALSHGGGPMPLMGDPLHAGMTWSMRERVPQILRLQSERAPSAVIVVTAHWQEREPAVSSGRKHGLLYDYVGFPPETYQLQYEAPGAPELAKRIHGALGQAGFKPTLDARRGWDHGVFVPFKLINPAADVPIVQMSVLASQDPEEHFRMGRALAAFREENVAIVGSGFASLHHLPNMFRLMGGERGALVGRVAAFNRALKEAVVGQSGAGREAALREWRGFPHAYEMHPRGAAEHFSPLLVCVGAAGEEQARSFTDEFCGTVVAALALAGAAAARKTTTEDLKQIEHVILFMQENRAFDHYFGTMAGVRGFKDPNAQESHPGQDVFHQSVNASVKPKPPSGVDTLRPWQLTKDAKYKERAQCMVGGDNGWQANHAAWNDGKIDSWVLANTPYSIGYYGREDVAVQFALAEEFLVGDAYYESLIGASDTNRAIWFSGTINTPGSNVEGENADVGGPVVDDHRAPGCEKDVYGKPMSCLPLKWKTVPEYLQEKNITWQVYQDMDNMFHDTLEQWEQYELALITQSALAKRGIYRPGIEKFFADAANGTLPAVSYLIMPSALSEHPPNTPRDGGWIQRKVAEAVMRSPKYNSTVLIISYDETGGWADHVMAPHASKDTAGEWMKDPFNATAGMQPIGPGFRVPFYIVSPWTRKGGVYTEVTAHESQILFLEKWAAAHGKGFHTKEMNTWRRAQMGDLLSAFDFEHADYSVPTLPRFVVYWQGQEPKDRRFK
ncbi:phospholipase C, partial [Malassezia cuniculi]